LNQRESRVPWIAEAQAMFRTRILEIRSRKHAKYQWLQDPGPGKPGGTEIQSDTSILAYSDDVKLLGDNTDTIKKNTETLIDASKEVGLETNVEKT
jgi:hypothetical protein